VIDNALSGFSLFLSFILVVGPQNAFVLRQGLARDRVFAVALTCALSDVALISVGTAGFNFLAETVAGAETYFCMGGAAFLFMYGALSVWRATFARQSLQPVGTATTSLRLAVVNSLALSWLNPLVYLDTIVLLGSVSTAYASPVAFSIGAMIASFVFFFSIGYGSRLLAPLFVKPTAWRIFDLIVAAIMFAVAWRLLFWTM
jgi:L-lysine exporter family protein LysE/ArgO